MATLLDLFKSQKKELYGKSESIRIESRGIINPPRAAALLVSSPNAIADLVGANAAGLIKGSANRPTDTIFAKDTFTSKPLSITGVTTAQLRDVVEKDTDYFVKTSPMPNLVGGFLQGASNPAGAATNALIGAVNTYGSAKKIKNLLKKVKSNDPNPEQYGTKFMPNNKDGKKLRSDKKISSEYYRSGDGSLQKREGDNGIKWDVGATKLLEAISIKSEDLKKAEYAGHIVTVFETIPAKGVTPIKVPFIGTVTGISEDVSPSWNSFKYLGSPFNVYRYSGVERSLRFNLKLYYTTVTERDAMITKINYLKSLAFPDKEIRAIKFGENGSEQQYAMAPNIVRVSIGHLYRELPGYIESLSFEIDDNASWPTIDEYSLNTAVDDIKNKFPKDISNQMLYPTIVDVSIGMKIIEEHLIQEDKNSPNVKTYRYDFDGSQRVKDNQVIEILNKMGIIGITPKS